MTQDYSAAVRVAPYYHEDAEYRQYVKDDMKRRLTNHLADTLQPGEIYTIEIMPMVEPDRYEMEYYKAAYDYAPQCVQSFRLGKVERHDIVAYAIPEIVPPPVEYWGIRDLAMESTKELRRRVRRFVSGLARPFTYAQVEQDIRDFGRG